MKIVYWKKNKLKFLGITIFKIKYTSLGGVVYILGLPVWIVNGQLYKLQYKVRKNHDFDMRAFDAEIEAITSGYPVKPSETKPQNIAFLASCCYDMGGHTKCIRDLIKSLAGLYNMQLFLTQKSETFAQAPKFVTCIGRYAKIFGVDSRLIGFREQIISFVNQIADFGPSCLLVYIHPDDMFGAAVVSMIKQNTKIKIIYFNHASHIPALGMDFADIILECMPSTKKITEEKRHLHNSKIIGLQSLGKDETIYYQQDVLSELKHKLGIRDGYYVTMSGGSGYKFFEDDSSPYFEMIKSLLQKEPKLYHVVISEFNDSEQQIINKIFKGAADLRKRLLIIPYQTDFDIYFQCADVFVDSFPVSSALTQIDLMRNKVASVVKINTIKPEYSFHEYQMPGYPYMFAKVDDMEKAILDLLHNRDKREQIIAKNYEYWLKTYESRIIRDKYINLCNGGTK